MDIDKLEAGWELDRLVIQHVFFEDTSFVIGVVPRYSTDIAAAWEVIKKLHSDGYGFSIDSYGFVFADFDLVPAFRVVLLPDSTSCEGEIKVNAKTVPLAICRAALKALTNIEQ